MARMYLKENWMLRHEELAWGAEMAPIVADREEGWIHTDLPCDVHMPLIEKGIIDEPLEADNFYNSEWIEDRSWWFKNTFFIDQELLKEDIIELTLESLDSHADVFLNGVHLGHHKSAHYPFTREVKELLKAGDNTLLVRLTSGLERVSEQDLAPLKGRVSTEKSGGRGGRGDIRRAMVRKPQYVYGWDWGPRVATCGIVKDVYIEAHSKAAIRGVYAYTKSIHDEAIIEIQVEIENLRPVSTIEGIVKVDFIYKDEIVSSCYKEALLTSGNNYIDLQATINDAKLWWPNGMGEQNLYTVRVSLVSDDAHIAYPDFKFGIRTLKLNLDRIGEGERLFALEVNGVRVFCKGANWVPVDSIYARVTDEKYDTLIREAKEANFNMLRIWGGGIYERTIFYEKCDEYGILIWHDFMFACSLYPDHLEWFRKEVENEINYQTLRLRNHASIGLWCGNNENLWIYESWWQGDEKSLSPGGIICYNHIAPRIVRQNCPNIPYWNSSPYGGKSPNDDEIGNRHHWHDCTMNPDMNKRITPEEYDKINSKFITEYGYIGPCCKSTIERYHGGVPIDRKGRIWQLHNNTFEKETVPAGIAKHYGDPTDMDLDQYLLYGGLCQGLMLGYSLEAIRFKQNCSGALFWMYSDCWGEVGWTIIDYYLKRKLSYYYVKRAFAPTKLILREEEGLVKVMGINDTPETISFKAEYGYMSFEGEKADTAKKDITLEPFTRKIVFTFNKGDHDYTRGICYVKPEVENQSICTAILRTGDFRDLDIPSTKLHISNFRICNGTAKFSVTSEKFAHGVHFNLSDDINLSDEYFDLLPDESREIEIYGVDDGFSVGDIKAEYVVKW